jgi:mannose-1-phosphate guanylyltransferase
MFQLTVKRAIMNNINHIYIVSNVKHNFMIREQMEELNVSNYTIISEPFGKDTCAAITSASLISEASNILVMSSDHVWEDDVFNDVVMKAVEINSSVNVFGIVPTYPETGYGYIKYEDNKLLKFVEKPDRSTAKMYV